jgi:hypothetical protein
MISMLVTTLTSHVRPHRQGLHAWVLMGGIVCLAVADIGRVVLHGEGVWELSAVGICDDAEIKSASLVFCVIEIK